MNEIQTATRNAELGDLVALLRDQHARKIDTVAPVSALRAQNGYLVVSGTEPVLSEDGVTLADGHYWPTAGGPGADRRCRSHRPADVCAGPQRGGGRDGADSAR